MSASAASARSCSSLFQERDIDYMKSVNYEKKGGPDRPDARHHRLGRQEERAREEALEAFERTGPRYRILGVPAGEGGEDGGTPGRAGAARAGRPRAPRRPGRARPRRNPSSPRNNQPRRARQCVTNAPLSREHHTCITDRELVRSSCGSTRSPGRHRARAAHPARQGAGASARSWWTWRRAPRPTSPTRSRCSWSTRSRPRSTPTRSTWSCSRN